MRRGKLASGLYFLAAMLVFAVIMTFVVRSALETPARS